MVYLVVVLKVQVGLFLLEHIEVAGFSNWVDLYIGLQVMAEMMEAVLYWAYCQEVFITLVAKPIWVQNQVYNSLYEALASKTFAIDQITLMPYY